MEYNVISSPIVLFKINKDRDSLISSSVWIALCLDLISVFYSSWVLVWCSYIRLLNSENHVSNQVLAAKLQAYSCGAPFLTAFGWTCLLNPPLSLHGLVTLCQNQHQVNCTTNGHLWYRSRSIRKQRARVTWNWKCLSWRYSARMSSMRTIWQKIRTRCPLSRSLNSNLSSRISLPLLFTNNWTRACQTTSSLLSFLLTDSYKHMHKEEPSYHSA